MEQVKEKIVRADSLRIKVDSTMTKRLERLARLMGLPTATLGAVAIGQYVLQQERSLSIVSAITDTVGKQVGEQLAEQMKLMFDAEGLKDLARDSGKDDPSVGEQLPVAP
jgi:predicted transcriptional regulator